METDASTHPQTTPEVEVPPPMKALLKIFLVVWEIAMKSRLLGFPVQSSVHNVTSLRPGIFPAGVEIWEFEEDLNKRVTGFRDDKDDADDKYLMVERANRKLFMCEFFCRFIEKALRKKLEELHFGTVQWVVFCPLPRISFVKVLSPEDGPEGHLEPEQLKELRDTKHSVLEITTSEGAKLILDGTPDQYDWNNGGWIIPKAKVEEDLMLGPIKWSKASDTVMETTEAALQGPLFRETRLLHELTQELLEGLEWERLMGLEEREREKEVAEQAQRKFKHVCSS